MSQEYFTPLHRTIRLLAVDDEPVLRSFYCGVLGEHPLYCVSVAASAGEAEEAFKTPAPPHLRLLDMGINDRENDDLYLLRKFGSRVPFIIISGYEDTELAFAASQFGAHGMVKKPTDFSTGVFWTKLREACLRKVVLPFIPPAFFALLKKLYRIVETEENLTVSRWAREAGITEGYLRRIWSDFFAVQPKHTLFIYQLYRDAFRYHDAYLLHVLFGTAARPRPPENRLSPAAL